MKITPWGKEINSLNNKLLKKEEKIKKSLKIKHTESSSSKDECLYYKKPSKQRKIKLNDYDYEYYDDVDYCHGPKVKQNKRKNYYYEQDDDNSRNKKDTQKRSSQEEEYEGYCDGDNDETCDNDIDKTNKKTPSKTRNKQPS